eukprot:m.481606 g.481606  ORF g.481606 m.481606 type:complete len:99 (+) comp22249_c0_seq1:426-722(+)
MAMCDELGPKGDHYMQDYVEEAAGVSLCSVKPPYSGCSEKEQKFITKMSSLSAEDIAAQVVRLKKMGEGKMKAELREWLNQRLAILKQLERTAGKEEL